MTLKQILKLTAVAAFAAALFVVVGCTEDEENGGVSTNPADLYGHAWVDEYPSGKRDGFILDANNGFRAITEATGTWTVNDEGTFAAGEDGKITVNTGWLYYNFQNGMTAEFAITDGKLTIKNGDFTDVFVKASGVNPTTPTP